MQNLGYLSLIFLEGKFGAPTRISEANFEEDFITITFAHASKAILSDPMSSHGQSGAIYKNQSFNSIQPILYM